MTSVENYLNLWTVKLRNPRKEKERRVSWPPPQGDKIGIYNGNVTAYNINKRQNQWTFKSKFESRYI